MSWNASIRPRPCWAQIAPDALMPRIAAGMKESMDSLVGKSFPLEQPVLDECEGKN